MDLNKRFLKILQSYTYILIFLQYGNRIAENKLCIGNYEYKGHFSFTSIEDIRCQSLKFLGLPCLRFNRGFPLSLLLSCDTSHKKGNIELVLL